MLPTDAPLKGIIVADFSRVLAGPFTTMMLGDLGADVVKVERPVQGDETRSWGPPFTDEGFSSYYLSVNRNKQSITIDLRDKEQCRQARRIALSADVMIENFRAGAMKRFGLDYESLNQDNPGLVYCRISGFGNKAGRDLPGYDVLAQALSGLMSITGETERPPMKTGVAIVDILTGLHATIGILAALNERQRTGLGQVIDVNLFSSALASLANQASAYLTAGEVPERIGNQHPSIAPYETLATASNPIVLAVGNDGQFRKLCLALESPGLIEDSRWSSNAERVRNRQALINELEAVLCKRPCHEWVEVLRDYEVPCAPINNIEEAFQYAEKLGLEVVQNLTGDDGSSIASVSNPITFSRTPVLYRRSPPGLGADTEEVLRRFMDMTKVAEPKE